MSFLLKRIGVLLIISFFFVGSDVLMAAVPSEQKEKLPIVAIESETYDFGEVWSGEILRHTFVLENKGNGNLNIKHVSPG
ncbi:MAG: DUF1573 domain-containing protein [Deltaproteobacteria bacterium]|nr:DUF1573 domain-containing protein [Deltaproteobacteria bacterium]